MEVSFTVTVDDFVAFNWHVLRKSGAGRTAYLFGWLGLPLLLALLAALLVADGEAESVACGMMLGFGAVVFLLAYPRVYRSTVEGNVRTFVKRLGARGIVGDATLIFSEDRLVAITELARTEVRWENLSGVETVGDHTYIFLTGMSGWILPRNGCDSDEEYEAACDFVLRKTARDERSQHEERSA